jgi:hypothetical protein
MGVAATALAQTTTAPAAPAQTVAPAKETDTNSPDVAAANQDVAAQAAARQTAVADASAEVQADAQAQYAADIAAYDAAVRANHRTEVRDARIYNHQQRAYADAMAAWRHQVYACKHGNNRACKAPTPDPANFW